MIGRTVKPETDAGSAEDEPAEVEAALARGAFLGDEDEPMLSSRARDDLSHTESKPRQTKAKESREWKYISVARLHARIGSEQENHHAPFRAFVWQRLPRQTRATPPARLRRGSTRISVDVLPSELLRDVTRLI